jgi:hypothetical protein
MKHAAALAAGFLLAGSLLLPSAVTGQQDAARPQPQDIGAQPGHLPKVHYIPSRMPYGKYPLWVDASMIFNPDGSVNATLIMPEGQHVISALLAKPREHGCVPAGPVMEDLVNAPDRDTIEDATKNSRLVVLGTVTEKAFGLSGDIFGQLLRVEPQEIFKGLPRTVPAYFVFMPVGDVKLRGVTICKTDSRYPKAPEIGDQVLLFAPDEPNWQADQNEPYLELLDDGGIVTISSDSTVSQPARFQRKSNPKSSASKSEEILVRVRAAAAKGDH